MREDPTLSTFNTIMLKSLLPEATRRHWHEAPLVKALSEFRETPTGIESMTKLRDDIRVAVGRAHADMLAGVTPSDTPPEPKVLKGYMISNTLPPYRGTRLVGHEFFTAVAGRIEADPDVARSIQTLKDNMNQHLNAAFVG